MRKVKILVSFLLMAVLFSCEEAGYLLNCSDCITNEPVDGVVEIRLDDRFISDFTINIYEGNLEDDYLIETITPGNNPEGGSLSGNIYSITLLLNRQYTVTAKYYHYGYYYIAVDAVIPRVKDMYDKCGETCFVVYDNICRMELLGF